MGKKNILACVTVFLFLIGSASAHPPSAIRLSYDATQRMLQIVVMHDTKKPAEHYIKTVLVELNKKKILEQAFSKQSDPEKRTAAYILEDVQSGDVIAVTGVCNVFGKKTEILKLQ